MLPLDVDRVAINADDIWDTEFVPWLESMENRKVGYEDGVFVATIDPAIRVLQEATEDDFVKMCSTQKLSEVSYQYLTEVTWQGLYQCTSLRYSNKNNEFRDTAAQLHSYKNYKNDTCCTQALKNDSGLEDLFNHLQSVINKVKVKVKAPPSTKQAPSVVKQEDSDFKLRQLHEMHSKSTEGFTWERDQIPPPECCSDLECSVYDDGDTPKMFSRVSPLAVYGYGYETPSESLKVTPNLDLCRIYNILWLLPHHYPGLHSSYLYHGTTHAYFPIHVEDALTWSVNYLYWGHPKIWVIVPPWGTELLEYHLHRGGLGISNSKCRNILSHKIALPTVYWLRERNISFKVVVQNPGDLVILYPSAAHFGFNTGANLAQAINIGTTSWIPWGINAKKCDCIVGQIHLNMTPLVSAFRRDLLVPFLNGSPILPSQMLRGLQLLHDALASCCDIGRGLKTEKDLSLQGMATFKCPAIKCPNSFPQTKSSKAAMM